VATASLSSGVLLYYVDWQTVNYVAIPFLIAAGAAIMWFAAYHRAIQPPADKVNAVTGKVGSICENDIREAGP
tara:strand:- start:7643 stop:7861 length:219 start_codon:yes stop_codon:yes gene_type:complete